MNSLVTTLFNDWRAHLAMFVVTIVFIIGVYLEQKFFERCVARDDKLVEEFQAKIELIRKEMKALEMKMKEELLQKNDEIEDLRRNEERKTICEDKTIELLKEILQKLNDGVTEMEEKLIEMDKEEEKQAICKDVNIFEAIFNPMKN